MVPHAKKGGGGGLPHGKTVPPKLDPREKEEEYVSLKRIGIWTYGGPTFILFGRYFVRAHPGIIFYVTEV